MNGKFCIDPGDEVAFVDLRMAALGATPGFVGAAAARERLAQMYQRAGQLERVHHVVRVAGRAVGQVVFFRDPEAWFGGPVVPCWIDRLDPDAAVEPLLEVLDHHALGPAALIEIGVHDAPLLSGLEARGFGIDSVVQVGDPQVALRHLRPAQASIDVVPLAPEHVAAVVALHREVFTAEPQWCWFGAYPAHLDRLAEALRRTPAGQFVVREAGRVVGHLGAEVDDNPYWGRVGGLELVLAPALRGRGLGRALYRVALQSLVQRAATVMKGGTSQPGVMALGREMQRPWHAFNMRPNTPFARAHFLRFAPASVARSLG